MFRSIPRWVVEEAVNAGRLIRALGVGTILLPEANCASACVYVFVAGYDPTASAPRRLAFDGARIGVHSSHLRYKAQSKAGRVYTLDPNEVFASLQDRIARLLDYLTEMGVPSEVQQRVFSTPSQEIYYLTESEKQQSKIISITKENRRWVVEPQPVSLPSLIAVIRPPGDLRLSSVSVRQFGTAPGSVFAPKGRMLLARWMVGNRQHADCLDVDAFQYGGGGGRKGVSMTFCSDNGLLGLLGSVAFSTEMFDGASTVQKVGFVRSNGEVEFIPTTGVRLESGATREWEDLNRSNFRLTDLPTDLRGNKVVTLRLDTDGDEATSELSFSMPQEVQDFFQSHLLASSGKQAR